MDQFSRWSGIAHSLLSKQVPKIKLCQVHQLLAACLGHRTYASLRGIDLEILNQKPCYVLFDVEAGFARAKDLGLSLTIEQWQEVTMSLRPSGVTPFWLTTICGMHRAAELTFADADDSRIYDIKLAFGFPDGHSATSSRCSTAEDDMPDVLRFYVEGEVQAFNDETTLVIPVIAVVEFQKVGRRIYGAGNLASVEQHGAPRKRELDESDFVTEYCGLSVD